MANVICPRPDAHQAQSQDDEVPAYSVFSHSQKNYIIGLAAFAGWFSSVSSFIYFPAIPAIAGDLDQSIERINLTVTSYLVVSGIFPSITGNAADRYGRRPVFIVALSVYLVSNVGLALQSGFGLLFSLRMLQSAGISGTFAVTYGVLGDLFPPAERGGYAGIISFFLNTPPSIGPLLSGFLLLRWSWRSIFWFLSAATPCCLVPLAFFLPETGRSIVGNGSVRSRGVNRPFFPNLIPKVALKAAGEEAGQEKSPRVAINPVASVRLLRSPGTAIIVAAYGVGYATYSCLQASLSSLFLETYDVSGLASGLIYIPFGAACAASALATGRLLDRNFRKTAAEQGLDTDPTEAASALSGFPIEKARLRTVVPLASLGAGLVAAYGWQVQQRVPMAGPLATQFVVGLAVQAVFTALGTLLVDVHPGCPATALAACNLVRCGMAAGCLAALDPLLRAVGPGWAFSCFSLGLFISLAMLVVLKRRGLNWRRSRLGLEVQAVQTSTLSSDLPAASADADWGANPDRVPRL